MNNTFSDIIIDQINKSIKVKQSLLLDKLIVAKIDSIVIECLKVLKNGNKIIFAGNGGSFADAQHLSAEFVSRFRFDRAPLASIVLGANNSTISAIGNDYGFENIFARELDGISNLGDIFIPITTSGNSKNIINSINLAKEKQIKTICLTGKDGGQVKNICDCIFIPSEDTARIQECHILVGHIICDLVEREYFKK